jgi:outer membrane protein
MGRILSQFTPRSAPCPLPILSAFLLFLTFSQLLAGEPPQGKPPSLNQPLTLEETIDFALSNYPAIRAALAEEAASASGVKFAKTSYLPRTDIVWEANRGTRNNVFGLYFPAPIPLPISGPVLGTNNGTNVWGSAAGFLFGWEPFDFGLRKARLETAQVQREQAAAVVNISKFEAAAAAADAFFALLAAEQAVQSVRANVARAETLVQSVEVLVKNELRPGADFSRAQAELAFAKSQLIQAEENQQISRVRLVQSLGLTETTILIQNGPFLQALPPTQEFSGVSITHPYAYSQKMAVDYVKARIKEVSRSYVPHFDIQAATFGRGTGALTNGEVLGGWNGLAPSTFNWAVGFTAKFQLFEYASIHAKKEIETHQEAVEAAHLDQLMINLSGQLEKAKAELAGARRQVEITPIQLSAAKATESQMRARYNAGLGTLLEVADAERLLTQSEIDDALARLRVWRGLLAVAVAKGDLDPFLKQVKETMASLIVH